MDYVTATLLLGMGLLLLGFAKVVTPKLPLVIIGTGLVISGLLAFILTDTEGDDCGNGSCAGALVKSALLD